MNHTEELQKNLTETCMFLKDITAVEKEKMEAAMKNNVLILEECIKKEQALVMRSRGLDQKRQSIQKAMGAEQLTLKQIVEGASAETKALRFIRRWRPRWRNTKGSMRARKRL